MKLNHPFVQPSRINIEIVKLFKINDHVCTVCTSKLLFESFEYTIDILKYFVNSSYRNLNKVNLGRFELEDILGSLESLF